MRDHEKPGIQGSHPPPGPRDPKPVHPRRNAVTQTEIHPKRHTGYARSIAYCLDASGSRMSKLVTQAKRIRQINEAFLEILPVSLTGHAILGKLNPGEWLVYTDSPVWATRLRYGLSRLRRQLSDRLKMPVPALRIRVAPRNSPPPPPAHRRMIISEQSARLLEGTARNVDDVGLKAALLRLATRAEKGRY